jgi:fructose-1,6-bisphosphatase-3
MTDLRFLNLLSTKYPNVKAASAEIINLKAILALPKGTEYFLSDLHGEHEAFIYMLKSASGIIREKIEEVFGEDLTLEEREALASLIYNAKAELARRKHSEIDFDKWCYKSIYQMIQVCKAVSTKYTRSKVRKMLPECWGYSMDELLHADEETNRSRYYSQIITSVIESELAEDYIISLSESVSNLAVDKLHIIGDIFDRGAHPDRIMNDLLDYHNVDFQWGNHDIVWMGAATGNWACLTNLLRMNISYNNFDMLEIGYGINLRALATFAAKVYADDPCEFFKVKMLESNQFDPVDEELAAKMHKAIAICQFKVEGTTMKAHPEYGLNNRLLLDKIDYEKGTIKIAGTEHELRDKNFPTIDPNNPYELTSEERLLMNTLEASVLNSRTLQEHIRFLYTHGSMYKVVNGNLLYHGCIPITEEGEFEECTINGVTSKGRAYMDFLDEELRKAYFNTFRLKGGIHSGDLMWYLWLGSKSPLFGKDQMTTFERLFVADKSTHQENTVPYYRFINEKRTCEMIIREFGLNPATAKILNGHVPVKIKDGESPMRGGGLLYIIDGGISKAYQKTTGIAGYTFIFNSRFMALSEHKPYQPLQPDGTQVFTTPEIKTVHLMKERMYIRDTDDGKKLMKEIDELEALIDAYGKGEIKEDSEICQ